MKLFGPFGKNNGSNQSNDTILKCKSRDYSYNCNEYPCIMKKAISILAAMLLFITRAAGMEPHPFYVSYSGEHGLFDTNIIGCCQDGFGRLWVGTSDGIYIYIPATNSPSLPTRTISCIAPSSLWTFPSTETDAYG